jgi:hypothetical protein
MVIIVLKDFRIALRLELAIWVSLAGGEHMAHVDQFLGLAEGVKTDVIQRGNPADDALLCLLVQVAFSDGALDDEELEFLQKVLPGVEDEELREWVEAEAQKSIDFELLAKSLPTVDERWKCLRFAACMAWKDQVLADEERELLDALAVAFGLPSGAVERTLADTAPEKRVLSERDILDALQSLNWSAVQLVSGEIVSPDLQELIPEEADFVARVGLDDVEVMAFYRQGLVARFRQGAAFVKWSELVTYSRSFGLGSSVELHTENGRTWTLVDSRLSGLCMLLERLFGEARKSPSITPNIRLTKGRI